MASLVAPERTNSSSSSMDSWAYRRNPVRTSQSTPHHSVAIFKVGGMNNPIFIHSYRPKDIHITLGQVTAILDTSGESFSIKSIWPSTSSPWVARMMDLCSVGKEDAALKEISLTTTEFKSTGKLQQLDNDLMRLDFATLPDIVLVGLLRNTYSVRAHIPSWNKLLDKTEKVLTAHKKNSRALLRGLKSHS